MTEETTAQTTQSTLLAKGYKQGRVFRRTDALYANRGLGLFTGEFSSNCDGVTMLFEDGSESLAEYCTPLFKLTDQISRFIIAEEQRMFNRMQNKILMAKLIYSD